MTTQIVKDQPIWLGGYRLDAYTTAAAVDYGADEVEVTNFASGTHEFIGGVKTAGVSIEGNYDATNDGVIDAAMGSSMPVLFAPTVVASAATSTREGEICYFMDGIVQGSPKFGTHGDLAPMEVSLSSASALVRGTIQKSADSQAATGQGDWLNLGALSGTLRAFGFYSVTSLTGAGNVTFSLESADDGAGTNATTRATFTTLNTGNTPLAEVLSIGGTITQTFWRIKFVVVSTVSFNFVSAIGIA